MAETNLKVSFFFLNGAVSYRCGSNTIQHDSLSSWVLNDPTKPHSEALFTLDHPYSESGPASGGRSCCFRDESCCFRDESCCFRGNEGRTIFKKDSIGHTIGMNRVGSGPQCDCPIKSKGTRVWTEKEVWSRREVLNCMNLICPRVQWYTEEITYNLTNSCMHLSSCM